MIGIDEIGYTDHLHDLSMNSTIVFGRYISGFLKIYYQRYPIQIACTIS